MTNNFISNNICDQFLSLQRSLENLSRKRVSPTLWMAVKITIWINQMMMQIHSRVFTMTMLQMLKHLGKMLHPLWTMHVSVKIQTQSVHQMSVRRTLRRNSNTTVRTVLAIRLFAETGSMVFKHSSCLVKIFFMSISDIVHVKFTTLYIYICSGYMTYIGDDFKYL